MPNNELFGVSKLKLQCVFNDNIQQEVNTKKDKIDKRYWGEVEKKSNTHHHA
jgi:hypothetical protein